MISWSQTSIEGQAGASVTELRRGAAWHWNGDPVRLDAAAGISGLLDLQAAEVVRRHAVRRAREVLTAALAAEGRAASLMPPPDPAGQTVTLTDGPRRWVASLIPVGDFARPFLLFLGEMPPRGVSLRVALGPERPQAFERVQEQGEGVVCFLEGTRLETPSGLVAIEDIFAGDKVVTKDGGASEVLWVGMRRVSQARLLTTPDLRPVRIAAGSISDDRPSKHLFVSPDHRMLVDSLGVRAVTGEPEVLVAARDLVGRPGVSRVSAHRGITYYHLMLERHGILVANGMETESFHPMAAELSMIAEEQRARLFDVMPSLQLNAANYGPPARRVLTAQDALKLAQAS